MRLEARNWLEQSEIDLDTVRDLKESGHLSAAAFYSHQAAEKALKGAIIQIQRQIPPKTHNLIDLLHNKNAFSKVIVKQELGRDFKIVQYCASSF